MRGEDNKQEGMFSYVSPERRVPADHPLRPIRKMVDEVLQEMSPQFSKLYADVGRPSIAPERLLRALLLQIFYTVRSERLLMEQLQYNLLFRWFVGMEMDETVWNHAVFSKNRERLLNVRQSRVVIYIHGSRLQPLPTPATDGGSMIRGIDTELARRSQGLERPTRTGAIPSFLLPDRLKNITLRRTAPPTPILQQPAKDQKMICVRNCTDWVQ